MTLFRSVVVLALALLGLGAEAQAQWPMDRTMTIVVPWRAGTGAELGIDLTAEPSYALEGSKGLPPEIVKEMNAAAVEVLKDPATAEKLAGGGITPSHSTPEELGARGAAEVEKWRPVVVKYNITSE
jgi:tripartite-type tricarboxylate transporter receptor subunit TctC